MVQKTHSIFSTDGEQKHEEYSCGRPVSVIAMERGKLWKPYRGRMAGAPDPIVLLVFPLLVLGLLRRRE